MARRVALIVGVERYRDSKIRSLKCVQNDCTKLNGFFDYGAKFDVVRYVVGKRAEQIIDEAHELVTALSPGDSFLFYFSGHGVERDKRHLLLCAKAKHDYLVHGVGAIAVDVLSSVTRKEGVHRIFILDACRSELRSEQSLSRGLGADVPTGFQSAQVLRDIVNERATSNAGSFGILCSCSEGQQAAEIPAIEHGLFTRALLDHLEDSHRSGDAVRLSDDLRFALKTRMNKLALEHGLPTEQIPWHSWTGNEQPVLLPERVVIRVRHPEPPVRASEPSQPQTQEPANTLARIDLPTGKRILLFAKDEVILGRNRPGASVTEPTDIALRLQPTTEADNLNRAISRQQLKVRIEHGRVLLEDLRPRDSRLSRPARVDGTQLEETTLLTNSNRPHRYAMPLVPFAESTEPGMLELDITMLIAPSFAFRVETILRQRVSGTAHAAWQRERAGADAVLIERVSKADRLRNLEDYLVVTGVVPIGSNGGCPIHLNLPAPPVCALLSYWDGEFLLMALPESIVRCGGHRVSSDRPRALRIGESIEIDGAVLEFGPCEQTGPSR